GIGRAQAVLGFDGFSRRGRRFGGRRRRGWWDRPAGFEGNRLVGDDRFTSFGGRGPGLDQFLDIHHILLGERQFLSRGGSRGTRRRAGEREVDRCWLCGLRVRRCCFGPRVSRGGRG